MTDDFDEVVRRVRIMREIVNATDAGLLSAEGRSLLPEPRGSPDRVHR